ncbi:hypothetical protein EON63_20810 [archaeon]|nr:MAG: hypothetical protein EON63_20810 [archaeon]
MTYLTHLTKRNKQKTHHTPYTIHHTSYIVRHIPYARHHIYTIDNTSDGYTPYNIHHTSYTKYTTHDILTSI